MQSRWLIEHRSAYWIPPVGAERSWLQVGGTGALETSSIIAGASGPVMPSHCCSRAATQRTAVGGDSRSTMMHPHTGSETLRDAAVAYHSCWQLASLRGFPWLLE